MFIERLTDFLNAMKDASIKETFDIVGVSVYDIKALERQLRLMLPSVFKDFLLACGSGDNHFLIDNGFVLYPRLNHFKSDLFIEAEQEGVPLPLAKNSVVFKTFLGEEFWFFNCGESDPEVFFLEWGASKAERTCLKLSNFIIGFFNEAISEKENAKQYLCLDMVGNYSYGHISDVSDLQEALNQINSDFDFFKQPLVETILVDDLLRCLSRLRNEDVIDRVFELLSKLDVKESQIASVLEDHFSELGLLFLGQYARQHKIYDSYLKVLLNKR